MNDATAKVMYQNSHGFSNLLKLWEHNVTNLICSRSDLLLKNKNCNMLFTKLKNRIQIHFYTKEIKI